MVVADTFFRPDMWIATHGDTPGWPLAMALPGLVGGRFATGNAWCVAISFHIGLLALFFDVARLTVRRFLEFGPGRAALAAWAFVLAALAVELSWTLLPTLLLIEEPQYYVLAAAFLALGVGLIEKRADPGLLAAATLMAITAYLFKTSFVVYAPSYLLVAGWLVFAGSGKWTVDRPAVLRFGTIVLSLAAVVLIWKLVAPPGRCQADTGAMIVRLLSDEPVHGIPFSRFAAEVLSRMTHFVLAWKLPFTLAALAGFALFVRHRVFTPLVLALCGLWLLFYIGVVSGMATCFTASEIEKLASVQRYTRVPLRLTQTAGAFLLLIAVSSYAARFGDLLRSSRALIGGLWIAVAVLGGWQVDRGMRSIHEVEQRTDVDAGFRQRVAAAREDVRLLIAEPAAAGHGARRILYFGPPPNVEMVAADFDGLGSRRGGPLRRLVAESQPLDPPLSERDTIAASLPGFDAIAIVGGPGATLRAIPAIAGALADCRSGTEGYLLIRQASGPAEWRCRPRNASTKADEKTR